MNSRPSQNVSGQPNPAPLGSLKVRSFPPVVSVNTLPSSVQEIERITPRTCKSDAAGAVVGAPDADALGGTAVGVSPPVVKSSKTSALHAPPGLQSSASFRIAFADNSSSDES